MPVRLNGSTSGYSELSAPAVAGNNTLTLPTGNGTNRQTLMGDGAGALSFSWDAGSLFYRLNADLVGANVNTAQKILGVGVTVEASTVYAFDAMYLMIKSAGTTSHDFSLSFGGTATLNNIQYQAAKNWTTTSATSGFITTPYTIYAQSAASFSIGTMSTASTYILLQLALKGTVSINAGGTFIPQYTLSAAPGGAYSTIAGSYIRLTPIGAAGSASSQGTWS